MTKKVKNRKNSNLRRAERQIFGYHADPFLIPVRIQIRLLKVSLFLKFLLFYLKTRSKSTRKNILGNCYLQKYTGEPEQCESGSETYIFTPTGAHVTDPDLIFISDPTNEQKGGVFSGW